jgi:hypothetical protein
MTTNSTNVNKTDNHLSSYLNSLNTKRIWNMRLEIQVMAWGRQVGLNGYEHSSVNYDCHSS